MPSSVQPNDVACFYDFGGFNHERTAAAAADYIVWRKTDSGNSHGYTDWRANFGEGIGGVSAGASHPQTGVPEPATMLMHIVTAAVVSTRRRWRTWRASKLINA